MPYNVCGGMQDNYNWCGPSATRFTRGIKNKTGFRSRAATASSPSTDPRDSRFVYTESQDGNIQRRTRSPAKRQHPAERRERHAGAGRRRATVPLQLGHADDLLAARPGGAARRREQGVQSNDRGDSWTAISPDLTTNADRNEITIMGVRDTDIACRATTASRAGRRLSRSPNRRSRPASTSPAPMTASSACRRTAARRGTRTSPSGCPGFPKSGYVSEVVPSRFDANTVYVTVDGHRENDYNTYIWASNDIGATFRSINANLQRRSRADADRRSEERGRALPRHRDRASSSRSIAARAGGG